MNLNKLASTSGAWLAGDGAETDIVVSTRIRLARNLATFPFTSRATVYQNSEIEQILKERLGQIELQPPLDYLPLAALGPLDRQFLVERQLVSRELAGGEGPRGVAFVPNETVSVMVNEEDHLRMQVMRSGLALEDAWETMDDFDNRIEQRIAYAYHEDFGYLTACPTNVGTGMRASVMLHLPALEYTRQSEQVFRALQKIHLEVRGLYGEGSRASGHFYQISNQVTLGKNEGTIIKDILGVIPAVIRYEKDAREAWRRSDQISLKDRIRRALETIRTATMMTSEEAMELLSLVRLGVTIDLVEELTIPVLNQLFIHTQPAHLQKLAGRPLDSEQRNAARARYLQGRLEGKGPITAGADAGALP